MVRVLETLLELPDHPRDAMFVGRLLRWAMASSMPASAMGISEHQVWERAARTFWFRPTTSSAPTTMPTSMARTRVVTNTEPRRWLWKYGIFIDCEGLLWRRLGFQRRFYRR